jgi:hypothetical protein
LPVSFPKARWLLSGYPRDSGRKQRPPTGVCDWSKPGVGQGHNVPWPTYQDAHGNVIYGGRPMGPPPRSKPLR